MLTILVFVAILGVLVFVHELGHFVVARRNGIKCDEFGFGFPPRAIGWFFDEKTKKWIFIKGSKEIKSENTVFSLNWIPIGGFVKMKGEDGGDKKEKNSFASKTPFVRFKVLIAGVTMNIIFAWIFFSATFMLGTFEDVTGMNVAGSKILIEGVEYGSPAQKVDLRTGDVLIGNGTVNFRNITDVQAYANDNRGKEIRLAIERNGKQLILHVTPREKTVANQGALGISAFAEVISIRYSFFRAAWEGLREIANFFVSFGFLITQLFHGNNEGVQAVGPVGIVLFTGKVLSLGFSFILHFAGILSINLAIINALPIPALDGGRILFILIEKIKKSPINEKTEQTIHTIGMIILLGLMALITVKELFSPEVLDNFKNITHKLLGLFIG